MKPKLIEKVDLMLSRDIAQLMTQIPAEESKIAQESVKGGAFMGVSECPFGVGVGEGADKGRGETEWVVEQDQDDYDRMFAKLCPIDGKITGAAAKAEMTKSKLPNSTLGKIWKMSDIDHDGMLDADEFALAMHLIKIKLDGNDLPVDLPKHLIPPSKRNLEVEGISHSSSRASLRSVGKSFTSLVE